MNTTRKNLLPFLLQLLCIPLLTTFTACDDDDDCHKGEGQITTKTLNVPAFKALETRASFKTILRQGPVQEIKATGHPNIIDRLSTTVSDGVWEAGFQSGCHTDFELTLFVTVPIIESVENSGAGNLIVEQFENLGDLGLKLSGSGNMTLNGAGGTENLNVELSGSGKIIQNKDFPDLKKLDLEIDGAGPYRGFPVSANHCDVTISGSGSAQINATQRLDASIKGSGSIYYIGFPAEINSDITGSGKVVKDD
ncbi:DUF2807 domain-containing protein [Fulvitalea axinellae]|uniref:DUF2807 domain-containing protein n=1 Tax=Fulvitalea axinellae TaxID=1182444 RepID=A0AAU9CRU2_9BACT|nr:DUF2807 domain-containing protein [Fulvitalea axinellae]